MLPLNIEVKPADLGLPKPVVLRDGRTSIIGPVVEADAAEICEMLPRAHAETDFLNYMPGEFQLTLDQEKDFIRSFSAEGTGLLIKAVVQSRIVAVSGAASPKFRRLAHHAELGITVLADFWGLGIGRGLLEVLLEWGRLRGRHKMYLRVYEGNARAKRLYDALGFQVEACLRNDMRRADGSLANTLVMSRFYP